MDRQKVLSILSNRMRGSGYEERFRSGMMKGIMNRWDQVEQEVKEGNRVMYRDRKEIREHKAMSGGRTSTTWFMKVGVSGTVSVPITRDSKLKNSLAEELSSLRGPY